MGATDVFEKLGEGNVKALADGRVNYSANGNTAEAENRKRAYIEEAVRSARESGTLAESGKARIKNWGRNVAMAAGITAAAIGVGAGIDAGMKTLEAGPHNDVTNESVVPSTSIEAGLIDAAEHPAESVGTALVGQEPVAHEASVQSAETTEAS